MSYSANQYNYATPLSSSTQLVLDNSGVQLVDGSTYTQLNGTIDENNIVTLTGDNTGTATQYLNYFIARSDLLEPETTYYAVLEVFEASGFNSWLRVTNNEAATKDSQIETLVSIAIESIKPGIFVYPVVSGAAAQLSANVSMRSYAGIGAGGNISIKYRLSLVKENPTAFVYEKFNGGNPYRKYFALHDNILDGSYEVLGGDAGLWGAVVSDSSGVLPTPYILTVEENLEVNAIRLVGSSVSYPVAFTIQFFNGDTLLHTATVTDNANVTCVVALPRMLAVTKYVVTITKVSSAGVPVRLFNAYNPGFVSRVDSLSVKTTESSVVGTIRTLQSSDVLNSTLAESLVDLTNNASGIDTVNVTCSEDSLKDVSISSSDTISGMFSEATSSITNTIDTTTDTAKVTHIDLNAVTNIIDITKDTLRCKVAESISAVQNIIDVSRDSIPVIVEEIPTLTNIHSVMKEPFRQVYGKVYITYTDP